MRRGCICIGDIHKFLGSKESKGIAVAITYLNSN